MICVIILLAIFNKQTDFILGLHNFRVISFIFMTFDVSRDISLMVTFLRFEFLVFLITYFI